jgi:exosortase E/protease (VPEID-CTERM system)
MASRQAGVESNSAAEQGAWFPRDKRAVLAVALLVLEVFFLRREFTTDHLIGMGTWWAKLLVQTRYAMPLSLCILGAIGLGCGTSLLRHYRGQGGPGSELRLRFPWGLWSLAHGLILGVCFAVGGYVFQAQPASVEWLGFGAFCFALSLLLLLCSLLHLVVPLGGFGRLVWGQRLRFSLGIGGGVLCHGVGIWLLGDMPFWRPMGAGTMWLAHHLLALVYSDLVLDPETLLLGTSAFEVRISRYCSGYEGAFLFLGFFSLFLYLGRARLRFPQVLWLLPVGIVLVYLLNALRIGLLIVVGSEFSDDLAMQGFHVNAGWPFFGISAWFLVLVSLRLSTFSKVELRPTAVPGQPSVNLYGVYLLPLVLAIGLAMLSASLTRLEWVGDLLKFSGVLVVVLVYRREYRNLLGSYSLSAVWWGLAGFLVWSLLFNGEPTERWELGLMPVRVLSFVLLAPLAEELAFRGFLMRRLAAAEFEGVQVPQIGLWPLFFSSLLFGALHEQWLAGAACGLIFGLAYRHRGRLGDAFLAHAVTNAGLVIVALVSGDWGAVS